MSQPYEPGHPVETEIDDSQNPTEASPQDVGSTSDHAAGDDEYQQPPASESSGGRQQEMLRQLQDMIDQVAREARPVMRELAAKSAELAALAAERAGPLAAKAAEKTQVYGDRFAARSKEVATGLRRKDGDQPTGGSEGPAEEPEHVAGAPDDGAVNHPWGTTQPERPTEGTPTG